MSVHVLVPWIASASAIALVLFGIDKVKARRGSWRISEFHLLLVSVLGGWPGGLVGMLLFRHKVAKLSFILKFAFSAVVATAGAVWLCLPR